MNTYFRKGLFLAIIIFSFLAIFSGASVQNATSAQNCVEPPSGLVSWWSGDTISSKNLPDIKGKNNGTFFGDAVYGFGINSVPGKVGNAIKFGGTTEWGAQKATGPFKMGNPANLNFGSSPFSLETWFNWEGDSIGTIIVKSTDSGSSPGPGYWLRVTGTKLEFHVGDLINVGNAEAQRATAPDIVPGVWYHAVATMDRDIMKLYVNGELKSTVGMKGTPEVLDANTTSDASFFIGSMVMVNFPSGTFIFRGLLDEVSVYNKALSQSEVKNIFNAGSAGKCKPSITPEPTKPPVSVSPTPIKTPAVLSNIIYPIGELGNCANQQECKTYCNVSTNYSKCVAFAQKNNLAVVLPAVFTAMQKGESPGQCKDETSCRNYCDDIDHIEECVNFLEKFKLASGDELKEIRKMADIKKSGVVFPGNCKNKESCMKYCDNSANAAVCMEFALKAGFIPKEDAEVVGKILLFLKSGGKMPSGCTRKESCDAYCAQDAHASECADFAAGAGFMTKEEAEMMKKTGGKGPGNCRSREVCDNYCKDETHMDECIDFAVKVGFMTKEEGEDAKKYMNQGPPDFSQVDPKWLACMEKEMGSAVFGRFKTGKSDRADSTVVQVAQKKCNDLMPDFRKEMEACLSKPTCAEFNSCFDALPKGNQQQGSGQSPGQGPQQGPPDEAGKKVQIRMLACVQEKMDACLDLSCSEFESCTKSLQQGNQGSGEQGRGDQKQEQGQGAPNLKFEAKMKACQDEKINTCLSKSCGELEACLKSLQQGGGEQSKPQSGQSQEQSAPNPALNAKLKVCQDEIKEGKMKEIKEKQTACLSRSCSEFDACLKALQPSGGDQGGQQGDQQGQGTPDLAVGAKIQACQKEKVSACIAKPCSEFQACLNSLGGGSSGGGQQQSGGTPDPAVQSKFTTCFPPPPPGEGGPPQSLLIDHSFLGAMLRYLLK